MLHHLLNYGKKHKIISESGFTDRKNIKWLIAFDANGNNPMVIPSDDKFFPTMLCPDAGTKAQGKASQFLADKASVVVCYAEELEPETNSKKHGYFIDLLKKSSIYSSVIGIAYEALSKKENIIELCQQLKKLKAKKGDFITIRVGNENLVDIDEWKSWWRSEFKRMRIPSIAVKLGSRSKSSSKTKMRCLLTGELIEPVKCHESKVTGLKRFGGRGGESMIAFDKDSYNSYGLKNALNAATSEEVAKCYVTVLNNLIDDHAVNLANSIAVYWYKNQLQNPEEEDILAAFNVSEESVEISAMQRAKELLTSIEEGRKPALLNNEYYTMLISGASGRVMVREYHEGSFIELVKNVGSWFDDMEIVKLSGNGVTKWSTMERIVTSLLQPKKPSQKYEDWIKPIGSLSQAFWRSALQSDTEMPYAIIGRLVPHLSTLLIDIGEEERKNPTERSQEYYTVLIPLLQRRMGLLKSYHRRKGDLDMHTYLNLEHPKQAYHCGRMLAVLARLQRAALGDVGAGVIQRYYSAASQTPGLVLGRLIRNAQNHLSKDNVKSPDWFEALISEISVKIGDSAPSTLDLKEQSIFALGYYQQLAALNPRRSGLQPAINTPSAEDDQVTAEI